MQDPDSSHLRTAVGADIATDLQKGIAPGKAASEAVYVRSAVEQHAGRIETPDTPIDLRDVPPDLRAFDRATWDFVRAYNELARIIHDDNVKKGFWPKVKKSRNFGEVLMLCVSELAESLEGDRKNLKDDHLPQYEMRGVELADCIIRIMDCGHGFELPVAEALVDKLLYNRARPFKHGKNY